MVCPPLRWWCRTRNMHSTLILLWFFRSGSWAFCSFRILLSIICSHCTCTLLFLVSLLCIFVAGRDIYPGASTEAKDPGPRSQVQPDSKTLCGFTYTYSEHSCIFLSAYIPFEMVSLYLILSLSLNNLFLEIFNNFQNELGGLLYKIHNLLSFLWHAMNHTALSLLA